jgi:hypothetical protein
MQSKNSRGTYFFTNTNVSLKFHIPIIIYGLCDVYHERLLTGKYYPDEVMKEILPILIFSFITPQVCPGNIVKHNKKHKVWLNNYWLKL